MRFLTALAGKYWWVLVLMIPLLVSYDNNPKVFEEKGVSVTLPPATADWARLYAERFDINKDLALHIMFAADYVGLPREIAFKLVQTESSFRPYAVSNKGAIGLTQVLPSTASIYGASRNDLFAVDKNLNIGFAYLVGLYEQFGNWRTALTAYNAGPTRIGRMVSTGRTIPTGYAQKVLGD